MSAPRSSLLLSRPVVIAGLLIASSLALGAAVLSIISTREIAQASARTVALQTTLNQLGSLQRTLGEAETGQRGFIITGTASYLEPYEKAQIRFPQQIATLRRTLFGQPEKLTLLAEIERIGIEKFADMERSVALRSQDKVGAAVNVMQTDRDLRLMDALRARTDALEYRLFADLAASANSTARRVRIFQTAGIGLISLAASLGLIGAITLFKRIRDLEAIIPVCAWTHRVRHQGKWISFEQYLHERFDLRFTHGISEEAAEALKNEAAETPLLVRSPATHPAPLGSQAIAPLS